MDTTEDAATEATRGRRAVLKKVAVAGGVAWTAPVLLSSAAQAQTSPGGGGGDPEPDSFLYRIELDAALIPAGDSVRPTGEVPPDSDTNCEPTDFGTGAWDDALTLPGFCVEASLSRTGNVVLFTLSPGAQALGFAIGSAAIGCDTGQPDCVLDGGPDVVIAGDGSSVSFDTSGLCSDARLRILISGPECV